MSKKTVIKLKQFALASVVGMTAIISGAQADNNDNAPLKLYTFDCGTINISNMDVFSTSGDYAGQQQTFTDTCYLIRHPKGDLLWDTGLPATLVDSEPMVNGVFTLSLEKSLVDQLSTLALTPADIDYVAISHSHFDHTGQLSTFNQSTWLVNETELHSISTAENLAPLFASVSDMAVNSFTGDHDVFGDGSVVILDLPGHTVGHTALQVTLANTGTVLLSGDLYHQAKSRQLKRVPRFNVNEAQTRVSMEKFEDIAQKTNAKVIIQHEYQDIKNLPKPPLYLD